MDFEHYHTLFAGHVLRLLKERDMSMYDFAKRSGISPATLSEVTRGGNPTLKMMIAIANGFGIPYPMFFKPLDSEEWQAVRASVQYATSCKPADLPSDDYVRLSDVILPCHKAAIVMDWGSSAEKEVKKLMKKRKDSERRTKEKEAAAHETDPKDEHDGN